jgi:hypothetical protein
MQKLGHLLFRQQKDVFLEILNAGFEASRDFKWRAFIGDSGRSVVEFTHVPTDYWFDFIDGMTEEECSEGPIYHPHYEWHGGSNVLEHSPGFERDTEIIRQVGWDTAAPHSAPGLT